jgi:hypothetical protein
VTTSFLLPALLQDWRLRLTAWSLDGSLAAAAREALQLDQEPAKLTALISQWRAGDFSALPPIKVLESSVLPGAAGAYATSTATIYLNRDWLASATADQVMAVLTEELGHHFDALLNAVDTPGDEGELFAQLLLGNTLSLEQKRRISSEDDRILISLPDGSLISAEASADTAAPLLTRAALSATSIDLSKPGAGPLSLTLGATDNLSGFDSAQFSFRSPSGNTSQTFFVDGFGFLSGSRLNGSFVGSINLGANTEAGTWTLSSVFLDDQAGNSGNASGAAALNALLPGLGSLSFSVINPSLDAVAPQLTRAALSATTVDLTQPGAGRLSLTIGATDNRSGFDTASFNFRSPSGNSSTSFFVNGFLSGSGLNGSFVGSINLGPNAEAGTWTLSNASLRDQAGNSRNASSAAELNSLLAGLGSLSFSVVNPAADAAAPQLTRAALSSTSIDFSRPGAGPLSLTIGATDDLSGFDNANFSFLSPSGSTSQS